MVLLVAKDKFETYRWFCDSTATSEMIQSFETRYTPCSYLPDAGADGGDNKFIGNFKGGTLNCSAYSISFPTKNL